jgi:hypothetical protein
VPLFRAIAGVVKVEEDSDENREASEIFENNNEGPAAE